MFPEMDHQTAQSTPEERPFVVSHRLVFSIAAPMTLAFLTTPLLGLVDMAVVGRLGDAALIGGLAVSAMLFDFVFATFNFFRASTTGLVAQAYGRGDEDEQRLVFWRALVLAVACGVLVILAGPLLLWLGLAFMNPGTEVAAAATTYLTIRVISAPAALANYAILGFVLGRGQAGLGLLLQTIINGANVVLSIWLGLWLGWGLPGVAWATVCAELAGCLVGLAIVLGGFRSSGALAMKRLLDPAALKRLLALNLDIMIRTVALLAAFAWFTRAGAQLGELPLAANAVLMNIFLLAAYYLDGLATAAEQIAGRAIGANFRPAFVRAVRLTVIWSFVLSAITTSLLLIFGGELIALMTTLGDVRSLAGDYLIWVALAALTGVLAFLMDGVFIGATWSRDMRNAMLVSLAIFVVAAEAMARAYGNHGLWIALNLFLLVRGLSLLALLPSRLDRAFGPGQAGIDRAA